MPTPRRPCSDGAGQAVVARLRRGAADVPAFQAGVERLTRGKPTAVSDEAQRNGNTERSLELQAGALWLLAGLLALTGVVVLSQALARQAFLESGERETLRAIGMTRRQLFAVGLLRALAVGAVGAAVAIGLAFALSPLAPLGDLARNAEPDPGLSIDVAVFTIGAGATILLTALLAAPAAWMAARGWLGAARRGDRPPARGSPPWSCVWGPARRSSPGSGWRSSRAVAAARCRSGRRSWA